MKPNILIIQSDQHAAGTIGCYGDSVARTEHIDHLASGGVQFTRCASNSPICTPARGTMQTGLYSHTHLATNNRAMLDTRLPTMGTILSDAGYTTGYAGKWHLGRLGRCFKFEDKSIPRDRRCGWQQWWGFERCLSQKIVPVFKDGDMVGTEKKWEPVWLVDLARDFIRSVKSPWAFYMSVVMPHQPEQCPQEYLDKFEHEMFPAPSWIDRSLKDFYGVVMRMYYAQVAMLDTEIGRLLGYLEEFGVADDTIVVYLSDHGDRLGHHSGHGHHSLRGKNGPFVSEFHIPMIIRWPGKVGAGVKVDALTDTVDFLPTLLELAGVPLLGIFQGDSMAKWCTGRIGPVKRSILLEHAGGQRWRGVWDGRFVYSPNRFRRYNGLIDGVLFDHYVDPHEQRNLFNDSEFEGVRGRLAGELGDLLVRTADPFRVPKS